MFEEDISLIVTQSQENHDRIENLLGCLRQLDEFTLLFEGGLVVLSPEDFSRTGVRITDGACVLSKLDARMITSIATAKDTSSVYQLPSINIYNGQTYQYQIREDESGRRVFEGVDFGEMRIQAVKMVSQDIVMLTGMAEQIGTFPDGNGNPLPQYAGTWRMHVPDGGFFAIDVTDRMVSKTDQRAFLILHMDIRNWR